MLKSHGKTAFGVLAAIAWVMVAVPLHAQVPFIGIPGPDPGCENYQAWTIQSNPRTDTTGNNNHAYPEYNATYWATPLVQRNPGDVVIIKGQYPQARYTAFQVYDLTRNVVDAIGDAQINPDAGTNNPFRSGTAQGTYTVRLVFGNKPDLPQNVAPNTIYTNGLTTVGVIYRIYYPNNPLDIAGGPVNPVLPNLFVNNQLWTSCPPRPFLAEESTLIGRLDNVDFVGSAPWWKPPIFIPPFWEFWVTSPFTPYYPSQDNTYLSAIIDRSLLKGSFRFDMVVIKMKAPSFADTQAGVPPYAPTNVRFWSICSDEPITSSVVRCIPDNKAKSVNGFVTFVISDPSRAPTDAVLNQWGATWLPWGALLPTDSITNARGKTLTNDDGVFFYNLILYRQTLADPKWLQSIENVSKLPRADRRTAMGDYWPLIGYCTIEAFNANGAACMPRN
jgi:hypothetical protein